jgi:hypothetical protein
MITAAQWLASAALHDDEEALFLAALRAITSEAEHAKRDYNGFPVQLAPEKITPNVAKAIQIHLHKDGWNVQFQLMAERSKVTNTERPVHWLIFVSPTEEENNAATVRFKGREN